MVPKALKHPRPGDNVKQRDGENRDKVKAFRIIQIMQESSVLTYVYCVLVLVFRDHVGFFAAIHLKRESKVCLFWHLKNKPSYVVEVKI